MARYIGRVVAMRWVTVFLLVMVGCGDDGSSVDGGRDAVLGDGGVTIAEPVPPVLPNLVCPAGWSAASLGEVSYCEPFPSGPRGCEIDHTQLPGQEGCVLIGTECPADGFAPDLPGGTDVVYVDAGAAAGGDGSRGAPLSTIGEAVDVAAAGTVIALRVGTYDEIVSLPSGVTLRGACTRGTVVGAHSPTLSSLGRIDTDGTDVRVENLRITGSRPGLWVRSGGSMVVRDVVVDGARIVGAVAQGRLEADALVVRNTRSDVAGALGHGFNVENGGVLVLRHGFVGANHGIGIFVGGAGSTAELSDVVVRATEPKPDDTQGIGVLVGGGGRVTASRFVVEGSRTVGINVGHAGSDLDAEDVVVRGTSAQLSDGTGGQGLFVAEGATAALRRAFVADNQHVGLSAFLPGAAIDAEDVIVVGTRARAHDEGGGAGAFATMGGRIALRRAWVEGNHTVGVGAFDGSALALEDLVIRSTRPQPADGLAGSGIVADLGTTLELHRARIEENHMVGVFVGEGATATIEDARIVDTRGQAGDGLFGRGIEAIAGAAVSVARAHIEASRGAGLIAFDTETRVTATDLRVVGTLPFDCEATGCPGAGFGVATRGATLDVERFVLEGNALAGAQVSRAGSLTLRDGVIADHPIGVNVQDAPFDEGAILDAVELRDNERNLDAQMLPIPEPVMPPRS